MSQLSSVQMQSSELCFKSLAERPECVEQLALWHHHEWLKSSGQAIEADTFGSELDRRISLLREHLDEEAIPSTFLVEKTGKPSGSSSHREVIASVSLVRYQLSHNQSSSEWLTNFYVLPEHRGIGIGTSLLEYAEHFARASSLVTLRLYTHDKQSFYAKRGWENLGDASLHGNLVTVFSKKLA